MSIEARVPLGPAGRMAIVFGGVLPAIAAGTMPVMLPGISDAFATPTNGLQIKMVSTALGLGMMIGAPIGGILADRLGRRPVLVLAALLFGLFGCGAMLATALWQLIASRFVVGLSSGALVACIIAVIGDGFAGPEQSRWIGYNGAVATFAILFLNPLAGALADTGWQRGFLIYAAAVPMLVLILLGIAPVNRQLPAARDMLPPPGGFRWSPIVLAAVVGTLATGTSLYWPFRLRELGVHSARDIALYALPNILLIGTAAFGYGIVRRHLAIGSVFMIAGFLCALGLVVAGMAHQPWVVAVGLMVEGAAVGLLTPNLSMYAISISPPESSARTIGLMKGALFGSPFLTQFALEPISRAGGAGAALFGIAALSLGLGAFMLARALGWRTGLPATV